MYLLVIGGSLDNTKTQCYTRMILKASTSAAEFTFGTHMDKTGSEGAGSVGLLFFSLLKQINNLFLQMQQSVAVLT